MSNLIQICCVYILLIVFVQRVIGQMHKWREPIGLSRSTVWLCAEAHHALTIDVDRERIERTNYNVNLRN